jgi:2-polyprenyl-6-methoxyphenol hydroxylase-like FAD-dependent oxidoreductase
MRREVRPPASEGGRGEREQDEGRAREPVRHRAYATAVPHVVIAGAGPAGAALAHVLARRGLEVTLVERQRDFAREFRGEVLMPSGIDVIEQLGLGGPFAAVPQIRPERLDLHRNGRLVTALEFGAETDVVPRVVSQPAMLEMLVAEAARFPGFRLLRGTAVQDLLWRDARVTGVRVRGEETRELPADLVIGADGRGSVVRRKAGLHFESDPEFFDVVWFKVPVPDYFAARGRALQAFIGRRHLAIAIPCHDGRLQMAWVIDKGTFGELRQRGIGAWVAEMAEHVTAELGAHLRAHRDATEHPFVLDVVCYGLPRWTAPGALVLGDAAHPMSPVGGQGLNIALRDALVAANQLVPALEGGARPDAVDAAARAFEAERRPEVTEIQRLQRLAPRILFQRVWWARPVLALVPWLLRSDAVRGRQGAVVRRFAFGTTDVKLAV